MIDDDEEVEPTFTDGLSFIASKAPAIGHWHPSLLIAAADGLEPCPAPFEEGIAAGFRQLADDAVERQDPHVWN